MYIFIDSLPPCLALGNCVVLIRRPCESSAAQCVHRGAVEQATYIVGVYASQCTRVSESVRILIVREEIMANVKLWTLIGFCLLSQGEKDFEY